VGATDVNLCGESMGEPSLAGGFSLALLGKGVGFHRVHDFFGGGTLIR